MANPQNSPWNVPSDRHWFNSQCAFFHQHHRTDRWDLTDKEDAFQLYLQIRTLSWRYLDLSILLQRDHKYRRSAEAIAKYSALNNLLTWLFPFHDNPSGNFSGTYNAVQREIAELEAKFEQQEKRQ